MFASEKEDDVVYRNCLEMCACLHVSLLYVVVVLSSYNETKAHYWNCLEEMCSRASLFYVVVVVFIFVSHCYLLQLHRCHHLECCIKRVGSWSVYTNPPKEMEMEMEMMTCESTYPWSFTAFLSGGRLIPDSCLHKAGDSSIAICLLSFTGHGHWFPKLVERSLFISS